MVRHGSIGSVRPSSSARPSSSVGTPTRESRLTHTCKPLTWLSSSVVKPEEDADYVTMVGEDSDYKW